MVKIRLARVGAKKQPTYRIVVTDSRKARNGKEIEIIGYYNPRTRPSTEVVQEDRVLYWLSVGAQPSESVSSILQRTGTMERFARFRSGENTIEDLVAEVEANPQELPSPRTNYPAPAAGESKIKAREAIRQAAEAEADAALEAEAAAEGAE